MGFEFPQGPGILKHTTEKGQLFSITDNAAQHTVGTKYYDSKNNKTYVYAYNAVGATLSDNDIYYIIPQYTGATGGNYTVEPIADAAKYAYTCVPAALVPTLYYGWVQTQGDVEVNASDTLVFLKETWAVGDELCISNGLSSTLADDDNGVADTCYAVVEDSRATSETAECTIYLIGREALGI